MLRYADFISDLTRLVDEAKRLRSDSEMHLDPAFRRWRHELETSLKQVERAGFELPGEVHVAVRSFGHRPGLGYSNDELFGMYQREMDDTIIELETIISAYERRGKPGKRTPWAWLRQNVSPHVWTWLVSGVISALVAAFVFGTWVGQTELYKQIMGVPNITKESGPAQVK